MNVRPATLDPPWRFHWAAAAACFALAFVGSYPGRLNVDTLSTFFVASTPGGVNNWHSPTLAWWWELPAGWLAQPTAGLAMQAALFAGFGGFLPHVAPTARGRAALAGEWVFRIGLAGAAGYVGKDAVMLLALLVGVQLLRCWPMGPSFAVWTALAGIAALFLLAKAPNFLTLVIALALALPFVERSPRRYAGLVVAALLVGMLAVPLNRTVDRHVFAARDLHPDKQLVLFDLAGISARTGIDVFAGVPGWPNAQLPSPQRCYLPYMWDSLAAWAPCGGYARAYDRFDRALTRHWLAQVAAHPRAYLGHRFDYFGWLMRSRDHASWGIAGRSANDMTDPAAVAELRRGAIDTGSTRVIAGWRPAPWTTPLQFVERALFRFPLVQWVGLLACLAVLVAGWLRRGAGWRPAAIVPAALGVGNAGMLLVFGVADPARYLLPTVALGYAALLALLAPPRTGN